VSGSALYEFFKTQPQDILIATLSDEANNIPTFSQRSILISKEYALPFHLGYYRQISQRAIDLIRAHYSQDLAAAQQLIQKYGVNFWLLERRAFTPEYLTNNSWLRSFQPAWKEALANLEQGTTPALAELMQRCSVFETKSLVVLQADCIAISEERGARSEERGARSEGNTMDTLIRGLNYDQIFLRFGRALARGLILFKARKFSYFHSLLTPRSSLLIFSLAPHSSLPAPSEVKCETAQRLGAGTSRGTKSKSKTTFV
jgi:hypothetical protein